jgi:5-methylcytosine-specific restriction endonuclease McrA
MKTIKAKSIKTLRNACDALLSPLVKKLHPRCLLCPNETQVAHHHIHKSQSSVLRYELDNLINLCNACHLRLHMNESFWASKIIQLKGIEWFNELERKKNQLVKTDRYFYEENLERLKELSTP